MLCTHSHQRGLWDQRHESGLGVTAVWKIWNNGNSGFDDTAGKENLIAIITNEER